MGTVWWQIDLNRERPLHNRLYLLSFHGKGTYFYLDRSHHFKDFITYISTCFFKQGNVETFHWIKALYAKNNSVDYLWCLNTLLNSHFTAGTFNLKYVPVCLHNVIRKMILDSRYLQLYRKLQYHV